MSLNSDRMSIISVRTVLSSAQMWTCSSRERVFLASVSVRSSALAGLTLWASSKSGSLCGAYPPVAVKDFLLPSSVRVLHVAHIPRG